MVLHCMAHLLSIVLSLWPTCTYVRMCVPALAVTTELKALTFLHAQSHGVQLIPVVVYPIYEAAYMLI